MRNTERNYYRNKALEIEQINTTNPTEFWKYVNSLGPKRKSNIPMEVYEANGPEGFTKVSDREVVMDTWRNDFYSLYNLPDDMNSNFDNTFYSNVTASLHNIKERELNNPSTEVSYEYNNPFTLEEIDKVCNVLL